jgi:hypothetical protein
MGVLCSDCIKESSTINRNIVPKQETIDADDTDPFAIADWTGPGAIHTIITSGTL